MKQKLLNKRKTKTRKYAMYGGQSPISSPPPGLPPGSAFSGFRYSKSELDAAIYNYVKAAYSIREAANAIKETSQYQNTDDPTNQNPGTRYLQRNSSASFKSAAESMQESLNRFYAGITGVPPVLTPISAPPPLGNPPYPPFALAPNYRG